MVFAVKNKVVLVTGGASGIGLEIVKELLKNGVKGVTIADINENGKTIAEKLQKDFNNDNIAFVKTDVVDSKSLENAFEITLKKFQNIDVLINNAGILNDSNWELEVDVNLKGTINGMILGLDKYLIKYKQEKEAVILNVSSISGVCGYPTYPIYGATKFGITGLTKCWGSPFHFDRTGVRVVAICPGLVDTTLAKTGWCNSTTAVLQPEYLKVFENSPKEFQYLERPEHVAQEAIRILERAPNGSLWIVELDEPAYEFILPSSDMFKKNVLK